MYLKAKYAATERNVRSGDVVLVSIPGAQRLALTPTNIDQLYGGSGSQWLHPGIRMLMSLGNSRNVAACIVKNLPWLSQQLTESSDGRLLEIKNRLETLTVEAGAQRLDPVARASLFLDYADREGISGIQYGIIDKVRRGERLNRHEVSTVAREVYLYLKRTKGAASFVKDGIMDYITGGEAGERAMRFLAAAVSPIFGKEADNYAENAVEQEKLRAEAKQVMSRLQQLTGLRQKMLNDYDQTAYPKGLEALVQAASEIKRGNTKTGFESAAAITDGINIHPLVYQMIWLLTGAEPGRYFLCEIDGAVPKGEGNEMLVPFVFKAANGTNVPEELRQYYLPTQDFASYMMVLDAAITNILLAYLHESRGENTGTAVHVGLVRRALSPNNRAVQIIYPEELVTIQGNPALTAKVAGGALARFKNGEIVELAARHMGLEDGGLSQENLEALVAVMDQAMPVLPVGVYQLASCNALLTMLSEQFQRVKNEELAKRSSSLFKRADKLRQTLQGTFGVNLGEMTNYLLKTERAITLFGEERIGFIRQILEWGKAT